MSQLPLITGNVHRSVLPAGHGALHVFGSARILRCQERAYSLSLFSDSEVRLLSALCWTGNCPEYWHNHLYYNRDGSTWRHHGHVLHDHNVLQALPRLHLHPWMPFQAVLLTSVWQHNSVPCQTSNEHRERQLGLLSMSSATQLVLSHTQFTCCMQTVNCVCHSMERQ